MGSVKGLIPCPSDLRQTVSGSASGPGDPVQGREPVLRGPVDAHTLWAPCISIQRCERSPTSASVEPSVVQHVVGALFPQ
jgi:hypothetical protein